MVFGAVAMFDVLGFKGIWKDERSRGRWSAQNVIDKMGYIRENVDAIREELQSNWPAEATQIHTKVMCLSDTVVVLVAVDQSNLSEYVDDPDATPEQNDELRAITEAGWVLNSFACLKLACIISARAIGAAAVYPQPLFNYRGAISVGNFLGAMELDTFLGPAVDECAEAYEVANGAFVLLTASAKEFYLAARHARDLVLETSARMQVPFDTDLVEVLDTPQLCTYQVPVNVKRKDAQGNSITQEVPYETLVINPLITWSRDAWEATADGLIELFGDDTALAAKRANTRNFLDFILANERAINDPARIPR